jgi:pimeloyl-ACP methyl ester carboxylesterase
MQRPVMQPTFSADDMKPEIRKKKVNKFSSFFKNNVLGFVKWCIKSLLSSPVKLKRRTEASDKPPITSRLVRGLAYRALFLPVLVALSSATLVFTGTHPSTAFSATDPATFGVYFDPVAFEAEDGTRLEGWISPVVSARSILEQRDRILRTKHPAVILVHDFGQPPQTVLPLFQPFHEDGIVVIAIGMRGTNASTMQTAGQTFGLKEAMDVQAAVSDLRTRPFVDSSRIAILGIGSGANAAVLAAAKDPEIKATILVDPYRDPDAVIRQHIGPSHPALRWMQPLCKWTFELGYRVDAEEMEIDRFPEVTKGRPSLMLDSKGDVEYVTKPETIKRMRNFLGRHLRMDRNTATTTTGIRTTGSSR